MEKSNLNLFKNRKRKIQKKEYRDFENDTERFEEIQTSGKKITFFVKTKTEMGVPVKFYYHCYRSRSNTSEYNCRGKRNGCFSKVWIRIKRVKEVETLQIFINDKDHLESCKNNNPSSTTTKKIKKEKIIRPQPEPNFSSNQNVNESQTNTRYYNNFVQSISPQRQDQLEVDINEFKMDTSWSKFHYTTPTQENTNQNIFQSSVKDKRGVKRKRSTIGEQTNDEFEKMIEDSKLRIIKINPQRGFAHLKTYVEIQIGFVNLSTLAFISLVSPDKTEELTLVQYGADYARIVGANCGIDINTITLETITRIPPDFSGDCLLVDVCVSVASKNDIVSNGFMFVKEKSTKVVFEKKGKNENINTEKDGDLKLDDLEDIDRYFDIEKEIKDDNSEVNFDLRDRYWDIFLTQVFGKSQTLKSFDFSLVDSKKLIKVISYLENKSDYLGYNLAIHLVGKNIFSVLKIVLERKKSDINHVDNFGNTCLHWAYFCGNRGKIIELLKEHGIDTEKKNIFGMKAHQFIKSIIFSLLISSSKVTSTSIVNTEVKKKRTPVQLSPLEESIFLTVKNQDFKKFQSLFEENDSREDPNNRFVIDHVPDLIRKEVKLSDILNIEEFPTSVSEDLEVTLFDFVCYIGNEKFFNFLFNRREQRIAIVFKKLTKLCLPLFFTAMTGNTKLYKQVFELLKTSSQITWDSRYLNIGSHVVLYGFCLSGNIVNVKKMLADNDVDVNKGLFTPLYGACYSGSIEIVKLLLSRKEIDVNKHFKLTPLYVACQHDHINIVKELLKRKDILINKGHLTPLYAACSQGNVEIVKLLLKRSEINFNRGKISPLYGSCLKNNTKIIEMLLSKKSINVDKGVSPNYNNMRVFTPLHAAISQGNIKVVKLLLNREKNDVDVNKGEVSPLYRAIKIQNFEMVKLLFQRKDLDVNKGVQGDWMYFTPLYKAVSIGSIDTVKMILQKDDVDVNKGENTPLCCAARIGNNVILEILLKRKDVDINKGKRAPFAICCRSGNLKGIELLLKRKDLDVAKTRVNIYGKFTPLCEAAMSGNFEILKFIFDLYKKRKIDIGINVGTRSPLTISCFGGYLKNVKFLLAKENIDVNNGMLFTPLKGACENGHIEIVKILLKRKEIDVNRGKRDTPLQLACRKGHVEIVSLLLARKDIDVNNSRRELVDTPLYDAVKNSQLEVVKLLLQKGNLDFLKGETTPLLEACISNNFTITKLLLKQEKINFHFQNPFLEALKRGYTDICILFLLREIKYKFEDIKVYLEMGGGKKELKEKVLEFYQNKSKFRQKYWKDKKYDLGIRVREFVKMAFVVGNQKYQVEEEKKDYLNDLKNSKYDASAMKNLFEDIGFDVSFHLNLSHEDFFDEVDIFFYKVNEESKKVENKYKTMLIVFYFAGHALTYNSQSFLLPVGFRKKFFSDISKFNSKSFSINSFEHNCSLAVQGMDYFNVIILDACRDSINVEINVKKKEATVEAKDGLKEISRGLGMKKESLNEANKRENVVYMYSTDPNARALDSIPSLKNSQNSPFTKSCLEHLKSSGKLEDIFIKIRNQCLLETFQNQRPWFSSSQSYPLFWNENAEFGDSITQKEEKLMEQVKKLKKIIEEKDKIIRELKEKKMT